MRAYSPFTGIPSAVVLPVLIDGIDEEEAEHLDALWAKRFSLSRCSWMVRRIISR